MERLEIALLILLYALASFYFTFRPFGTPKVKCGRLPTMKRLPMTREKAIELLQLNIKEANKKMPLDILEALELAVSDMEYFKDLSGQIPHIPQKIFPNGP